MYEYTSELEQMNWALVGWRGASEASDAINLLYSGQILFYILSIYLVLGSLLVRSAPTTFHAAGVDDFSSV
jgi:hypothetical protein